MTERRGYDFFLLVVFGNQGPVYKSSRCFIAAGIYVLTKRFIHEPNTAVVTRFNVDFRNSRKVAVYNKSYSIHMYIERQMF